MILLYAAGRVKVRSSELLQSWKVALATAGKEKEADASNLNFYSRVLTYLEPIRVSVGGTYNIDVEPFRILEQYH